MWITIEADSDQVPNSQSKIGRQVTKYVTRLQFQFVTLVHYASDDQ